MQADLIIYMAFINVIKCTYKIWSHSEIIWAKKIKKKNLSSPLQVPCANPKEKPKWILFLWTFNYKMGP